MAYLFPAALPGILEDVVFNETVEIKSNLGDPLITSIEVTKSAGIESTLTVTTNIAANTFTITGKYNDNFDKSIVYEDSEYVTDTAARWKDVRAGYNFITKYTPSSGGSVTCNYTVTINGVTSLLLPQVINNTSYTPGQNYLIQYVAQGKY